MPFKGKALMGKSPIAKPKPGKPAPKGGTVFERKIQDNSQKRFVGVPKKGSNKPIGGAGSIKKKPVMPRRGGR